MRWQLLARQGQFQAIPVPFPWSQSVEFAHLLDGYKVLGFEGVAELANTKLAQAEFGAWHGTARDLWLCLFFEHRRERHAGMEMSSERKAVLDNLCETLRRRLVLLDGAERMGLLLLLERFPGSGAVEDLNEK